MKTNNEKTLVLCGGHFSPALAVIERIRERYPAWNIVYFGRMHPLDHDPSQSLEYKTVTSLNVRFYPITSGRFKRHTIVGNSISVIKIPVGFVQSLVYLFRLHPDAILGFGGYISAVVCFAGWLLRIPVLIHEQTMVFGLANRMISRIASAVCVSFSDTKRIPDGIHPVLTGNPLRQSFVHSGAFASFGDKKLPLMYITGGSVGSQSVNMLVKDCMKDLVRHFRVLHQCGAANDSEDLHSLLEMRSALDPRWRENYSVVAFTDPLTVGSIMREAAVIVSRSGANTVYEIAAAGTPAVLIPLPWSADGEQQKNARLLADTGLATVLDQEKATSDLLYRIIMDMYDRKLRFDTARDRAKKVFPMHGADRIVEQVTRITNNE